MVNDRDDVSSACVTEGDMPAYLSNEPPPLLSRKCSNMLQGTESAAFSVEGLIDAGLASATNGFEHGPAS